MARQTVDADRQLVYSNLAVLLTTALGVGYQSVAICQWIQFAAVLYIVAGCPSHKPTVVRTLGGLWLALWGGTVVAFAGTFNLKGWTAIGVLLIMGLAVILASLMCLCALVQLVYTHKYPESPVALLVFPTMVVALWFLWGRLSPFGSYGHPSYSQWSVLPVVNLASLFGLSGILFMMTCTASVLVAHFDFDQEVVDEERERSMSSTSGVRVTARHWHTRVLALVGLGGLLYGGGSLTVLTRSFYQRSPAETTPPVVRLGCVIGALQNSSYMLQQTEALAQTGQDAIVWSEEAVTVRGASEEAELVAQAGALCATYRTYIGLSYEYIADDGGPRLNVFRLLTDGGATAFHYRKVHLVPGIEASFTAGDDALPPVAHTPFGTVSAAICFDLDFPDWIRGAAKQGASLLIQPSWTWGPIGYLHARDNAFRAVEGGFHMFRCSSGGASAAFSPKYETLGWKYTNDTGSFTAEAIAGPVWG